jgi:hypothetical protein
MRWQVILDKRFHRGVQSAGHSSLHKLRTSLTLLSIFFGLPQIIILFRFSGLNGNIARVRSTWPNSHT